MLQVEELRQDKERLEIELEITKQKLHECASNKSTDILESENHELRVGSANLKYLVKICRNANKS